MEKPEVERGDGLMETSLPIRVELVCYSWRDRGGHQFPLLAHIVLRVAVNRPGGSSESIGDSQADQKRHRKSV